MVAGQAAAGVDSPLGRRFDSYQLPNSKEERERLVTTMGRDGYVFLKASHTEPAPAAVRELPLVDMLRRIWRQQFYCIEGEVYWRTKQEWGQPPAHQLTVWPEDLEVRTFSSLCFVAG